MSDQAAAELLRSDHPFVLIEAPAGCGKTFQGAAYARDIAKIIGEGRLLILTHTHAACGVFTERTKGIGNRVETKTIDALIAQIAAAYYKSLNLPPDPALWAWQDNGKGFDIMAKKVAAFLDYQPMVARALARRYPVVICDEHQDSTAEQHAVVMAIHQGGSILRVFGDSLQRIYGQKNSKMAQQNQARWELLKQQAVQEKLDYPHRWKDGCPELGQWVRFARGCLEKGEPIDLTNARPESLRILIGNNTAQRHGRYQLSKEHRSPIDDLIENVDQMMILASQNDLVTALRAFWNRSIPIWEGHTREALAALVSVLREKSGDAEALAEGLIVFLSTISAGFSKSSHGDRLLDEIQKGCSCKTTGKPANIQSIAWRIIENPSHIGVANAFALINDLIEGRKAGFDKVKIDHRVEFKDAIRLGQFSGPDEAFTEISRKRSYAKPSPPSLFLSSIHKAKGLECDNTLVMNCDSKQFSATAYSRCKMYVALSRAKKSLTLVIPNTNPSPLFKMS